MPMARFSTMVEVEVSDKNRAVANAASYLAYADQSDMFGYHGKVDDVRQSNLGGTNVVSFLWQAPVSSSDDLERVQSHVGELARVTEHVCVSNPVGAKN